MRDIATLSRIHWSAWVLSPLMFAILYRKHGGFYYRSTISLICLAFSAVYGVLASLTLPIFGKAHLINWSVARLYYHLAGFLLGITVDIEGGQYLDLPGSAVYVCNHQSSLDVLFMAGVFPKATAVVAKKALKYYPFLGWYMTLSKAIFLDRANRDSAIKSARQAADDIHRKKTSVWLFPEGTRGHPSKIDLLPFKKGAFYMAAQAQVPVIPIVVANYCHVYHSKKGVFRSGTVNVKVLPPISTKGIEQDSADIDRLSTNVRQQMLEALIEISANSSESKSQ